LQDLVILVYAAQSNRSFRDNYGPADPGIGRLRDEWKLEQQELPPQEAWDAARERAARLFGVQASGLCNASNLDKFAADVLKAAGEKRERAAKLLAVLRRLPDLPADSDRLKTAIACAKLLDKLDSKLKPIDVVKRLHSAEIATSLAAMDRSVATAGVVLTAIEHTTWALFDGMKSDPAGAAILDKLNAGLTSDEYVVSLVDRLRECSSDAARLNTLHLIHLECRIVIRSATFRWRVRRLFRGRKLQLLILRLTPRGLILFRLDTTR
jgi:hypothetical protein